MSESERSNEHLLEAPTQDEEAPVQGTNHCSRACKITGLTLLAGVLILGQVTMAYFLFAQSNDITALQEQNSKLERELTIVSAASMPIYMEMPFGDVLDLFTSTISTKVVPTEASDKRDIPQSRCQQEAEGASRPKGFRPACDELGFYQLQQCYVGACWCVKPVNGELIPGSMTTGAANCKPNDEMVNKL